MIEIIKKVSDLTKEDLVKIFKAALLDVPEWALNDIEIQRWEEMNITEINCFNTGYMLSIYEDYSIEIESTVYSKIKFNLIPVTNILIEIGAINIK